MSGLLDGEGLASMSTSAGRPVKARDGVDRPVDPWLRGEKPGLAGWARRHPADPPHCQSSVEADA